MILLSGGGRIYETPFASVMNKQANVKIGAMIGEAGAGAKPVPYKELTADKLADGIKQLLTEEAAKEAKKIADSIEAEGDGAKNAVTSFHRSLVLRGEHSMRCSILEDRVAVWMLKHTSLRLCALAAELLVQKKRISWKQLRLIRHNEWQVLNPSHTFKVIRLTSELGTIMKDPVNQSLEVRQLSWDRLPRWLQELAVFLSESRKVRRNVPCMKKRNGSSR